MWEYVLGGAALFGLIVGLFGIYNGRATRKMLMEEERATRELMERISKQTNKRFEEINKRFEALLLKSSEEHKAILEAVKK